MEGDKLMGTYDLPHGSPRSPNGDMPCPSKRVEDILGHMEERNISTFICDMVVEAIEALEADLAEATERIETLEHDLAVNKNAYSVWYKRCLKVEAREQELKAFIDEWRRKHDALLAKCAVYKVVLRPFAEAHIAAEHDDIDDDTYETGEGFYRVDISDWGKAAALLRGEGAKEVTAMKTCPTCKKEHNDDCDYNLCEQCYLDNVSDDKAVRDDAD